jgi:hypothetical protein
MQRLDWEQRSCRGECGMALLVKPGSVNPHNDWCRFCCPLCARQAAEAPLRFSGVGRIYGEV